MPKALSDVADPDVANAWRPIDERVMGGVSRRTLRSDPGGHAMFEGEASLERNSGIASVYAAPAARGSADARACILEVRGEARRFNRNLLTDDAFDGLNHQAPFNPAPDR